MKPRIAIPEPCSYDREYSTRTMPPYLRAIETCGGEPVVLDLSLAPESMAKAISGCSGVLLPGSKADVDPQKFNAARHPKTAASDPLREAAEELLLQDAYNLRKPIFAICYGLQSLNVWRTGTLVQHIESAVTHSGRRGDEFAHQVTVEPDSLLAREIGVPANARFPVNSTHHQAAETPGDGLRVVARCTQDQVIEALEGTLPGQEVLAVQWHPERTFDRDCVSRRFFEWLVAASQRWQQHSSVRK
ncbi:MAG TPA: gamma-glutamyl-gamma-aminobutyrate hydrolase family protein [Terriglobales bacterium]|nr:gamma-glutamyl-gamma-aminobutyrate hydrolase family protein [Terriglobales bacterium]